MKKRISLIVLGLLLGIGSLGMSFADDTTSEFSKGMGRLKIQNMSQQERLDEKIKIIDERVKGGQMTQKEGEEYKEILKKRMEECITPSENQGKHEPLGLGLGRRNGMGKGRGLGIKKQR